MREMRERTESPLLWTELQYPSGKRGTLCFNPDARSAPEGGCARTLPRAHYNIVHKRSKYHILFFAVLNQMSGVSPTDEAKKAYKKLSKGKLQYLVFKIEKVDGLECIVTERSGASEASWEKNEAKWEELCCSLPEEECRFVVFDFRWSQDDGRLRKSRCLITWMPEDTRMRRRMLYGATKAGFEDSLGGINSSFIAHDMEEMHYERSVVLKK